MSRSKNKIPVSKKKYSDRFFKKNTNRKLRQLVKIKYKYRFIIDCDQLINNFNIKDISNNYFSSKDDFWAPTNMIKLSRILKLKDFKILYNTVNNSHYTKNLTKKEQDHEIINDYIRTYCK